jgi:hypothetical protein
MLIFNGLGCHPEILAGQQWVSINLEIWFYRVETGDKGESIEPEESQ